MNFRYWLLTCVPGMGGTHELQPVGNSPALKWGAGSVGVILVFTRHNLNIFLHVLNSSSLSLKMNV